MFANVSCFQPSLIFRGKARSQPLDLSPIRGSTLVSSSLACRCHPRVAVTDIRKHSSLLQYDIHFQHSLIFRGKAGSQLLDLSPISGSTLVSSSLAYKCYLRLEVTDIRKRSSLLRYDSHFQLSQIYRDSTLVSSSLASECYPRLEVTDICRHCSLL